MAKEYNLSMEATLEQVKRVPNPTGKGGLGDHPENINYGGKPKNAQSFVYWYRVFKDMSVAELKDWQKNNPEEVRTVAADLAYTRVVNSKRDIKEFQEVADRSEGKAMQTLKHEGEGVTGVVVQIITSEDEIDEEENPSDEGISEELPDK